MKKYKYLLLDRDGVINIERPNDYVKTIDEFIFIENAKEAMSILGEKFDKIFLITNQRGVGRGIMTEAKLHEIHDFMINAIKEKGGRVDHIYFCTDTNNSSINRKPNLGMAYQIVEDYPEVEFDKCIMVGNSLTDIQFANKLNIHSVLVGDKYPEGHNIFQIIDQYCENLYTFASQVQSQ